MDNIRVSHQFSNASYFQTPTGVSSKQHFNCSEFAYLFEVCTALRLVGATATKEGVCKSGLYN